MPSLCTVYLVCMSHFCAASRWALCKAYVTSGDSCKPMHTIVTLRRACLSQGDSFGDRTELPPSEFWSAVEPVQTRGCNGLKGTNTSTATTQHGNLPLARLQSCVVRKCSGSDRLQKSMQIPRAHQHICITTPSSAQDALASSSCARSSLQTQPCSWTSWSSAGGP